jgi:hypothetical protein
VSSSFRFDTSGFESPRIMEAKLKRAVMATMRYWDGPVETHMKHHAPWNDQTTNARNGLAARAAKLGKDLWGIILRHSVDYGVYLELGTENMRARPIIEPTIRLYAPRVIASLTRLLDRLG